MSESGVELSDDNTNKQLIVCQNCPSKILKPGFGTRTLAEFNLPIMKPKSESEVTETEIMSEFWTVEDMYHFENIGFSKDVGDIKYLICADCEIGPIGYHNKETKLNYISIARVKHTDDH